MEDTEMVFQPIIKDLEFGLGISVAILLGCAFAGWYFSKQKEADPRKRIILPMLFYFGGLLALMSIVGNLWSWSKYPVLELNETGIQLDGIQQAYPNADELRIEMVQDRLNGPVQILFLQGKGGKTYALPGDRYPVADIMRALKKRG